MDMVLLVVESEKTDRDVAKRVAAMLPRAKRTWGLSSTRTVPTFRDVFIRRFSPVFSPDCDSDQLYYGMKPLIPAFIRHRVRRWYAFRKRSEVMILADSSWLGSPGGSPGWPEGKKFALS